MGKSARRPPRRIGVAESFRNPQIGAPFSLLQELKVGSQLGNNGSCAKGNTLVGKGVRTGGTCSDAQTNKFFVQLLSWRRLRWEPITSATLI